MNRSFLRYIIFYGFIAAYYATWIAFFIGTCFALNWLLGGVK
jgi:hypothetical protein